MLTFINKTFIIINKSVSIRLVKLKIKRDILLQIGSNTENICFETGGIIGSKSNEAVTDIVFDLGINQNHPCSYMPNTDYLNAAINQWEKESICFCGMFHTHFCNVKSLSSSDKRYIYEILKSMPPEVKSLYFPIFILPDKELVPYLAYIENDELCIKKELLEIID